MKILAIVFIFALCLVPFDFRLLAFQQPPSRGTVLNRYIEVIANRQILELRSLLRERRSDKDDAAALEGLRMAIHENLSTIVETYTAENFDLNLRDTSGKTPLVWAAYAGRVAIVQRLLAAGASVNMADTQTMTPLHHAALNQSLEIVQLLIAAGADVNPRTRDGRTPLDLARLQRFTVPAIPLLGPGAGYHTRLLDTPVAKYLKAHSK